MCLPGEIAATLNQGTSSASSLPAGRFTRTRWSSGNGQKSAGLIQQLGKEREGGGGRQTDRQRQAERDRDRQTDGQTCI